MDPSQPRCRLKPLEEVSGDPPSSGDPSSSGDAEHELAVPPASAVLPHKMLVRRAQTEVVRNMLFSPSKRGAKSDTRLDRFSSRSEQVAYRRMMTGGHLQHGWLDGESSRRADRVVAQNVNRIRILSSGSSGRLPLFRAMVCTVLVLVNTNDTVMKSLSQQRDEPSVARYNPSSVMIVSNVLSVLIGQACCALLMPPDSEHEPRPRLAALRAFWAREHLLQMSAPAVLFTASGTLKFVALGMLPPDVVVTMEQSTVLLCAAMGWAFLAKRYSAPQWLMLLVVSASLLWYQQAQRRAWGPEAPAGEEAPALVRLGTGLLLMCGSVLAVTAGGLSCEVLLKDAGGRPFYVRKAQMEVAMAVAGLTYCLAAQPLLQGSSSLWEQGFFAGWDRWTLLVLCLHTAKSWLATTTVLLLDNLTFTLAGNVAMLLVYVEKLLLLSESPWESFDPEVLMALVFTALGVAGFAAAASRKKPAKRSNSGSHSGSLTEPLLPKRREV